MRMSKEHWTLLALTAGLILTALGAALTAEPHSRRYRWTRRLFWSFLLHFFFLLWM